MELENEEKRCYALPTFSIVLVSKSLPKIDKDMKNFCPNFSKHFYSYPWFSSFLLFKSRNSTSKSTNIYKQIETLCNVLQPFLMKAIVYLHPDLSGNPKRKSDWVSMEISFYCKLHQMHFHLLLLQDTNTQKVCLFWYRKLWELRGYFFVISALWRFAKSGYEKECYAKFDKRQRFANFLPVKAKFAHQMSKVLISKLDYSFWQCVLAKVYLFTFLAC